MTNPKRARGARDGALTSGDWIAAAGRAIVEGGVAAVAVEPLARRLGVTKGSFYWHFPNRDALLVATLERWEEGDTEAAIAALVRIADPRQRLRVLFAAALTDAPCGDGGAGADLAFGHAFDLAVADAAAVPAVRPILRRVTERRIDFIADCYRGMGIPPAAARHHALLAYAAYVGTLRLARETPSRVPQGDAYAEYGRHLIATLILPDAATSP